MIPVNQTLFYNEEKKTIGNSMTACFASYLNMKVSECPNFESMSLPEVEEWLDTKGYEEERTHRDPSKVGSTDDFYIAWGMSDRDEPYDHFIIMKKGNMVHDPFPGGKGLMGEPAYYTRLEKVFDSMPEKEEEKEKENPKESIDDHEEKSSLGDQKVDEKFMEDFSFTFEKVDAYTGRAVFKMILAKDMLKEVVIRAERLTSIVKDNPDKDAWMFVYNEVGKGNSRIGKKIYFKKDAHRFVNFFRWINGLK